MTTGTIIFLTLIAALVLVLGVAMLQYKELNQRIRKQKSE